MPTLPNSLADSSNPETHYRVCHLCEALCGLEIKVDKGKVISIKGDKEDPFSQGHVCPKAVAIQDIHEDPDRIEKPIRRVGSEWQEIEWEEAFEIVTTELIRIREKNGPNSTAIYLGNPSIHNWGMTTHAPHFFSHLKTRNRYSATSVDQLPHHLIGYWMYGHQLLVPIPDIDRTQYMLVIGGNPMASNGSIMSVPNFRGRLKALKARGGKLVVIDPRFTETAEVADEHCFIKPGSDAYFLFALLNTLIDEKLTKIEAYQGFLVDWDVAVSAISNFTPELAESKTGISAEKIKTIARDLAAADGAVCYGRLGVSVQKYGALCHWAIQLINIATGNLDSEGGSMFNLPAVDLVAGPNNKPGHYNVWQSRVRGLPEFGGELPVAVLAEEILTEGEGQIKALVTGAGNPVLSTPNGVQLEKGLKQLEFMVSIDFYINETTKYADIILPPTSPLEHDHYDLALNVFAVHNVAKYSPAVFSKSDGTMHDWEIFTRLGEKMAEKLGTTPRPSFTPTQILEMGLQMGPYGKMSGHKEELCFDKLVNEPHGLDLGLMESCLPSRLRNEDKKIQCAPAPLIADLQRMLDQQSTTGLLLIGRRHVRSNNSWMHNYKRLVKGKSRCQLMMHPEDVERLGLQNCSSVRVSSRVGEVVAELEVTDAIMPGVVSLPHGWGHHRKGVKAKIASEHAGVSANDLTDEMDVDMLSGNAVLNGVEVRVSAAEI